MTTPRIPVVAPRPGELAVIAARVRVRRRRKRIGALAGTAAAALLVTPLLLAHHDTSSGLRPARRPLATPSHSPTVTHPANGVPYGGLPATATAPATVPPPTVVVPAPACTGCATTQRPPSSNPAAGTLTITGNGTSYGLLTTTTPTTLDVAGATQSSLGSHWTGFAIADVAALWTRDLTGDTPTSPGYLTAAHAVLPPGTYAVYLLAPSAATVTVPWTAPDTTVEPSVPVASGYGSSGGARGPVGVALGTTTRTAVTLVGATYSPGADGVTLVGCVARRDTSVCDEDGRTDSGHTVLRIGERFEGLLTGLEYRAYVTPDVPGVLGLATFWYDAPR